MDQQIFNIWFAGFYEGEGTVCNDKSNNNRIRVSVAQNDNTPLLKAKEIWGGSLVKRTRQSPASEKICTGYEWRLCHHDALAFFEVIRPFMIIPYKIKQYEQALEKATKCSTERYQCNFCDKDYANPSGRRRHEKNEHIAKGQVFTCDLCPKTFKCKDSVIRHKKINHAHTNASPEVFVSGQDVLLAGNS